MSVEIKRVVGSTKVIDKDDDNYLTAQISLNAYPETEWINCFFNPKTWTDNEAQPRRCELSPTSNTIVFHSRQEQLKENVKRMDDYIQQANTTYKQIFEMETATNKRMADAKKQKRDEIDKINESIKDL